MDERQVVADMDGGKIGGAKTDCGRMDGAAVGENEVPVRDAGRAGAKRKREYGLDCVRILAVCLLFWLHFYLRNGFYYEEITDFFGFAAVSFRSVFMCCIPLFLMLTGYLHCGRKWTASGYRSILPILVSYTLVSLIHLVYKVNVANVEKTVGEWVLDFLTFKMADYSWYIGMYIGLFLLIPLMNLVWSGAVTKKQHIGIVATLIGVTFLTSTVNTMTEYLGAGVLPAYFTQIYYVTYYFIGCYIRTYRPKGEWRVMLPLVPLLGAVIALANVLTREEANSFYSGYSASYSHLVIAVMSVFMFLSFYEADTKNGMLKRIAATISGVVLEMYLLSYLFDSNIYVMYRGCYTMKDYIWVGFVMTLAVYVLSFLAASIVNRVTKLIVKLIFK
jgi:surface polysaccharide O-acyltransferase-like enzyme